MHSDRTRMRFSVDTALTSWIADPITCGRCCNPIEARAWNRTAWNRTGLLLWVTLPLVLSAALFGPAQALRQVTSDPGYELEPDWSPDGSQIAFARWDSTGGATHLYVIDASGGASVLACELGLTTTWPAWSPDGKHIALSRSLDGITYDAVLVVTPPGDAVWGVLGGRGDYRNPTWSPDGKWIAFDLSFNHASEIGVVASTGGRPEFIISDGEFPAWSPDSTRIAFRRWNIWVASSSGENQRQLTDFPGGAGSPCWSPDSKYIAFDSNHSGNEDIWVVPIAGGDPVQVTTDPGWDGDPTWSPHGDEIAFSSTRAGESGTDIWVIKVNLTPTKSISWGKLKTLSR